MSLTIYPPDTTTGTVTSVSVVTANGISGSVATATSTPAITINFGAWTPASASGPAGLAFAEDTDNGANTITLKAPASVAANVDVTLPDAAGTVALVSVTPEVQDGAAYELLPADNGKVKIFTHDDSSAITVTYAATLPIGFNCMLVAGDAGVVTVAASGTTINSLDGNLALSGEFASATLVVTSTNVGLLVGALA